MKTIKMQLKKEGRKGVVIYLHLIYEMQNGVCGVRVYCVCVCVCVCVCKLCDCVSVIVCV